MEAREAKDRFYEAFANTARAIASPKRIEILELLAQTEYPVEEIARITGMTIANTSSHLQVLKQAKIVESRKQGTKVFYQNASLGVSDLLASLRTLTRARVAEVDQVVSEYFTARDSFEPLSHEELLQRTKTGDVIILDVRPTNEYAHAHIPGAISVPLGEIEAVVDTLPKSSLIVAYCRGPFCVLAPQALEILSAHGYETRRLASGMPEWQLLGLPVETNEHSSTQANAG